MAPEQAPARTSGRAVTWFVGLELQTQVVVLEVHGPLDFGRDRGNDRGDESSPFGLTEAASLEEPGHLPGFLLGGAPPGGSCCTRPPRQLTTSLKQPDPLLQGQVAQGRVGSGDTQPEDIARGAGEVIDDLIPGPFFDRGQGRNQIGYACV